MSKRTAIKKITIEAKTLRHLREQRGLSMRQAALLARVSPTLINLLENGRQDIHNEHIEKLVMVYGTTREIFELYKLGTAALPRDAKRECLELISSFNAIQVQSAEPLLRAIASVGKMQIV